ncbi:methyltransferase [Paenibacillus faecis]|uniref:class I SAM-dependent methyltransferase n=1 Tax=Paenibacillus faecis TaxID=862114 RepID=UPI001B00D155|nr:class I SAM-dependent methyltransferase [Paenibacillus faecis]GIO83996.1 methyltransferase [Paenibacillus faecis]
MEAIIRYYNQYDESSRLTTDHSRRLEFITTTHVLDQHISNDHEILDLGAGTGIYSFYYAEKGNPVVSTDITPRHVQMIETKADELGMNHVRAKVIDARDLSRFESGRFDVVLCLGPIYHLTDPRDQERCIRECIRVLKPGGNSCRSHLIQKDRKYLEEPWVSKILDEGRFFSHEVPGFWTDAYFHSPSEMEQLLTQRGIGKIANVATDGVGQYLRDLVNALSEEEFKLWVVYHLRTCSEPSILGMSNHGLFVGRKTEGYYY